MCSKNVCSNTETPRRDRRLTLLIFVAITTGVVIVGCLSVGGLSYFAIQMMTYQFKAALNDNPVVIQRAGEITGIEIEWIRSALEINDDVFVLQFTGTKASGVVTAEFIAADSVNERVASGTLELSSGETYELVPEVRPALKEGNN